MLAAITGTGAGGTSLGDAWADTTPPHGRLLLTVLGGLAEFERELIRARTSEGRARAKARGVHLGRRPKLPPLPAAQGAPSPRARRAADRDRPLLEREPCDALPPDPLVRAAEAHGWWSACRSWVMSRALSPCRRMARACAAEGTASLAGRLSRVSMPMDARFRMAVAFQRSSAVAHHALCSTL